MLADLLQVWLSNRTSSSRSVTSVFIDTRCLLRRRFFVRRVRLRKSLLDPETSRSLRTPIRHSYKQTTHLLFISLCRVIPEFNVYLVDGMSPRQGFRSYSSLLTSIFRTSSHCEDCDWHTCGDSIRTFLHYRRSPPGCGRLLFPVIASPGCNDRSCRYARNEIELLIDVCIRAAECARKCWLLRLTLLIATRAKEEELSGRRAIVCYDAAARGCSLWRVSQYGNFMYAIRVFNDHRSRLIFSQNMQPAKEFYARQRETEVW